MLEITNDNKLSVRVAVASLQLPPIPPHRSCSVFRRFLVRSFLNLCQYVVQYCYISYDFPPLITVYAQPFRRKDADEDVLDL
jgi:hypothetical protein